MAGIGTAHLRAESEALLRVEHLVVEYPVGKGQRVHAVSDVSFDILPGETVGLVGESGCGKSTVGRAVLQLPPPTSGSVVMDGHVLTALDGEALRQLRPTMQLVFQDPIASLNDQHTVREVVGEGLRIWGHSKAATREKVDALLHAVGIDPEVLGDRRPRAFSGGQCQRLCIARALALSPRFLVCDEPVSSLDVSVQAQILNLLADMKERYELTMLFITHDLGVVKSYTDRLIVMYLGRVCEVAPTGDMFESPAHPYTRLLLDAAPRFEPTKLAARVRTEAEDIPSPLSPPSGCRFRTRCDRADATCSTVPEMVELRPGHFVACHHPVLAAHERSVESDHASA